MLHAILRKSCWVKASQSDAYDDDVMQSLLSLFYLVLHFLAARKGDGLYLNFDPPIPSFKHQLHAWAVVIIRLAVMMWSTSCIVVSVGIHYGGGGNKTVRLDVDMFACSVGFVFGCVILCIVEVATRPFDLPWISPSDLETDLPGTGQSEEKGSSSGSSDDNDRTLRVTIGHRPNMPSNSSSSNMTGSTSSSQTRARKFHRTRRYILEVPPPISMNPVKPPSLELSDDAQRRSSRQFEETLVPRASQSESYFTAITGHPIPPNTQLLNPSSPEQDRSSSPATVIYVGENGPRASSPQHPPKTAEVKEPQRYPGFRRQTESHIISRLQRKTANRTEAVTNTAGLSTPATDAPLPPSPPPPPPPPPRPLPIVSPPAAADATDSSRLPHYYNVPGSWMSSLTHGAEGGYI